MNRRSKQHRRLSQIETLEKRNLLAFGLRSFLASSFHDDSVPAAEVARSAVVKTAPIVALSSLATEATPVVVAVAVPVTTLSAVQPLPSVESAPQAASLRTSEDLESSSKADTDSPQPDSVESFSAESLPTERLSLRTLLRASAQPNTSYQHTVAGVTLGTVTTDGAGDLSLELTPVSGQPDGDTEIYSPDDESLSTRPEQVPSDESHAVDPVSETSHESHFDEVNGNTDVLADVETSALTDHSSNEQPVSDASETENPRESNGSEDSSGSIHDIENVSQDATNSIDDTLELSHELVDEVHSEVEDIGGRMDDNLRNDVQSFEQNSSIDVLENNVLESLESNESGEQHDVDPQSEGHGDGLFEDNSHVENDLQDLDSTHEFDDVDTGNDDNGLSNDHILSNDDGLSGDDSHLGDDLNDSKDLDSRQDSDDVGTGNRSDDADGFGDSSGDSVLSNDDGSVDDDSHVDEDLDGSQNLASSHDSDDVGTGIDSDNDDGFGDSTVDNNQSHDDDLFDDDSRIGDDFDDSQDHDSSHDSDDVGSSNDDNNLSDDLDNDDGLSSDDVPISAGSTTQAYGKWKTYLSGIGTAEIEFEKERGETEFEVEVRGFAPNASFPVMIGGVLVGQIRTDSRGRGKLEYQIGDDHYRPFPAEFPVIEAGVTIQVGTQLSGVFGSARSGHHDD
ncbi:hypothetical protein Poly51_60210 [Rubripirellula tenax]|uniref:Uncharacterized protein n=1 Tax=Rubripirellula tenax TaxID=2528015 RepID=A0A5C6E708_9BACT|nr:hypothetical protein [Rubripirellula tenax]TWU44590.1 hypothetical protein Poly51_60210 [Rubripirellula tenax]